MNLPNMKRWSTSIIYLILNWLFKTIVVIQMMMTLGSLVPSLGVITINHNSKCPRNIFARLSLLISSQFGNCRFMQKQLLSDLFFNISSFTMQDKPDIFLPWHVSRIPLQISFFSLFYFTEGLVNNFLRRNY